MAEIVESDEFGNPVIIRKRILITNSLINDKFVLQYVGKEAWLYEKGIEQWVMTDDNLTFMLLPYLSPEKPGEYYFI